MQLNAHTCMHGMYCEAFGKCFISRYTRRVSRRTIYFQGMPGGCLLCKGDAILSNVKVSEKKTIKTKHERQSAETRMFHKE